MNTFTRPGVALGVGLLFAVPFAIANTIAVTGFAPLYPWLVGLGPHIIFTVLALGFVGGFVALLPLFVRDALGVRRFYLLNAVVGLALVIFFTVIGYALGEEIYRCDILQIPNCD